MAAPLTDDPLDGLWSCFSCDYLGADTAETDGDDGCEHCPQCGTQVGDGFGMAENDWRYRDGDADRMLRARKAGIEVREVG